MIRSSSGAVHCHAPGKNVAGEQALVGLVDLAGAPPPNVVLEGLMDILLQFRQPGNVRRVFRQKRVEQ